MTFARHSIFRIFIMWPLLSKREAIAHSVKCFAWNKAVIHPRDWFSLTLLCNSDSTVFLTLSHTLGNHTSTRTHIRAHVPDPNLTPALLLFCLQYYALPCQALVCLSHRYTLRVPSRADKITLRASASIPPALHFPHLSVSGPFCSLATLLAHSPRIPCSIPSPSSHHYGDLAVAQSKAMLLSPPALVFASTSTHLGRPTMRFIFTIVALLPMYSSFFSP